MPRPLTEAEQLRAVYDGLATIHITATKRGHLRATILPTHPKRVLPAEAKPVTAWLYLANTNGRTP